MRQPDPATDVLERLSTEPDVAVCGSEPPRGQQSPRLPKEHF